MDFEDFNINYLCMEAYEIEETRQRKIEQVKAQNKARLRNGKKF